MALFSSSSSPANYSSPQLQTHVTSGGSPQILTSVYLLARLSFSCDFNRVWQKQSPKLSLRELILGSEKAKFLWMGRLPGTLGENKVDSKPFASVPLILWLEKREVSVYEKSPCLMRGCSEPWARGDPGSEWGLSLAWALGKWFPGSAHQLNLLCLAPMDPIEFVSQVNQFSKTMFPILIIPITSKEQVLLQITTQSCCHSWQRQRRLMSPRSLWWVDNLGQAFRSFEDRAIDYLYMIYILVSFMSVKKEQPKRGGRKCWLVSLLGWQLLALL